MKENILTELTDFDSNLLRTVFRLLVSPSKVINDKSHQYAGPVRYALTILGAVFFVYFFIDNWLFADPLRNNNWSTPLREQNYIQQLGDVEDSFSGLVLAITMTPGMCFVSKLLFFKKEGLRYFYKVTLYYITQITLIMYLMAMPSYWIDIDISLPSMIVAVGYTAYFFLSLKLGKWYISMPKIALSICAGLITYGLLSPVFISIISAVMIHPDRTYDVEVSADKLFLQHHLVDGDFEGFDKVIHFTNDYYFIDQDGCTLGKLTGNEDLAWIKKVENQFTTLTNVIGIPDHQLIIVQGDSVQDSDHKSFLCAYSTEGLELSRYDLGRSYKNSSVELLENDSSGITLLISPGETQHGLQLFLKTKLAPPRYFISTIDTINLEQSVRYCFPVNGGYVTSIVRKPDWHYAEFGVAKYDSGFKREWYRQTYDKDSPYDPRQGQIVQIDKARNEIIVQYNLANDTIENTFLWCFDAQTGNAKWKSKIWIHGDYSEFTDLAADDQYIYLCGETHRDVRDVPWKPNYHAALIAKVDRNSGELLSYKHFGNNGFGGHAEFRGIFLQGDSVVLFGSENSGWSFLFLEKENANYKWVLNKDGI